MLSVGPTTLKDLYGYRKKCARIMKFYAKNKPQSSNE